MGHTWSIKPGKGYVSLQHSIQRCLEEWGPKIGGGPEFSSFKQISAVVLTGKNGEDFLQ